MTKEQLEAGLKFRTINTPRDCYHVITRVTDKFTDYDTVYPNGMHPGTSGTTDNMVKFLSRGCVEFLS